VGKISFDSHFGFVLTPHRPKRHLPLYVLGYCGVGLTINHSEWLGSFRVSSARLHLSYAFGSPSPSHVRLLPRGTQTPSPEYAEPSQHDPTRLPAPEAREARGEAEAGRGKFSFKQSIHVKNTGCQRAVPMCSPEYHVVFFDFRTLGCRSGLV
jgi:hypothetical protein